MTCTVSSGTLNSTIPYLIASGKGAGPTRDVLRVYIYIYFASPLQSGLSQRWSVHWSEYVPVSRRLLGTALRKRFVISLLCIVLIAYLNLLYHLKLWRNSSVDCQTLICHPS